LGVSKEEKSVIAEFPIVKDGGFIFQRGGLKNGEKCEKEEFGNAKIPGAYKLHGLGEELYHDQTPTQQIDIQKRKGRDLDQHQWNKKKIFSTRGAGQKEATFEGGPERNTKRVIKRHRYKGQQLRENHGILLGINEKDTSWGIFLDELRGGFQIQLGGDRLRLCLEGMRTRGG